MMMVGWVWKLQIPLCNNSITFIVTTLSLNSCLFHTDTYIIQQQEDYFLCLFTHLSSLYLQRRRVLKEKCVKTQIIILVITIIAVSTLFFWLSVFITIFLFCSWDKLRRNKCLENRILRGDERCRIFCELDYWDLYKILSYTYKRR